MDLIGKFYLIKDGDIGPPKIYLGANIGKVQASTGKVVWEMSAEDYCVQAVNTMITMLQEDGYDGLDKKQTIYRSNDPQLQTRIGRIEIIELGTSNPIHEVDWSLASVY